MVLLNRLFGSRSKKTSKLRVSGLYVGGLPRGPAQMANNAQITHKWPITRKMVPFDDVIMKSFFVVAVVVHVHLVIMCFDYIRCTRQHHSKWTPQFVHCHFKCIFSIPPHKIWKDPQPTWYAACTDVSYDLPLWNEHRSTFIKYSYSNTTYQFMPNITKWNIMSFAATLGTKLTAWEIHCLTLVEPRQEYSERPMSTFHLTRGSMNNMDEILTMNFPNTFIIEHCRYVVTAYPNCIIQEKAIFRISFDSHCATWVSNLRWPSSMMNDICPWTPLLTLINLNPSRDKCIC